MSDHERTAAYLAAIVESSDDAIISKDLDTIVRSFNRAAERMFGYSAAEMIGQSIKRLIPPDRQHEEDEILARIRRGERVDHYETVRVRKDGTPIEVSLTISPVCDAAGRVVGASKIARDITERNRAARALAVQQEWFRVTLNSIGDGVIASDPVGRVTFLNREAEKLTGWTSAEARGRPLVEVFRIIHEESRDPVPNPTEQVLRTGQVVGLGNHTLLVSREGTEWPIADSAAPIVDRDGEVIGVVLVFRETVARRRTEEQARLIAAERERLLKNERAFRAQAEEANRAKDDFMAMVSHELRTPLNAILGWTELLRRPGVEPDVLAHGLEVISRNTRVQAQLISDLLDVSRMISGKLRLSLESVRLDDVVRDSVEALRLTAEGANISLSATCEADLPPFVGDPARLQQIVWNLLSNAIKFTSAGGRVDVRLRRTDSDFEITVTDSGIGIRPEFLPDLFERFRQGAAMTTRQHGGLGLGLSITKHLAELHGGGVHAASEGEGRGAVFTVRLPVRAGVAPARSGAKPRSAEADLQAESVSLRDVRILLVEDEHDTRDLVRRMLEAHGADVVVAATANEGLELLADQSFDLLVSDIALPEMDGYELIRRVRALEGRAAHLPAIALTAFARFEDRTRALRAGFNAHVAKPVEPAELVVTVGSFANWIRSARQQV